MTKLLTALALLLTPSLSQAQIRVEIVAPEKKLTAKHFEGRLKYYSDWSDNLGVEAYFKDVELKHKETGAVRKFVDLPAFEKAIFFVMSSEKLTVELEGLHIEWQRELERLKAKPPEEGPKADDVQKYVDSLVGLRKKTAARYEGLAEALFRDYKHRFTDEERERFPRKIREYHDANKLIERKKTKE